MIKKATNVVLCILDGWGVGDSSPHNGFSKAHLPCWTHLIKTFPYSKLNASEDSVGLPLGQMGNSEVGHMTIGSGRVVKQDLPKIDLAIQERTIPQTPEFQEFLIQAMKGTKRVHLMGLLSPGGVHSHQDHFLYLTNLLAESGMTVYNHVFLDGRDTPPQMGLKLLGDFLKSTEDIPSTHLVTMGGRYFAMDRDKRWERIEKAYQAIRHGQGPSSLNFSDTIKQQYKQKITDEFIPPHVREGYEGMKEGDALVMVNFRADRVRQLLHAFLDPHFEAFERKSPPVFSATLGMAEYSPLLTPFIPALFKKQESTHTLGEVISKKGLRQLRIAETEKYAHVTFFFNAGRESPFEGEDRKLIPSPLVSTYDLCPEMSAQEITDWVVEKIHLQLYSLIVVNYANPDMVGHTGVQEAIVKALEAIDICLKDLMDACQQTSTTLVITADHGNAEQMYDETTNQPHTAHTLNSVPFVVIHGEAIPFNLTDGSLKDVAPTLLEIMGMTQPLEMTGQSLITWKNLQKQKGH